MGGGGGGGIKESLLKLLKGGKEKSCSLGDMVPKASPTLPSSIEISVVHKEGDYVSVLEQSNIRADKSTLCIAFLARTIFAFTHPLFQDFFWKDSLINSNPTTPLRTSITVTSHLFPPNPIPPPLPHRTLKSSQYLNAFVLFH